MCQMASLHRHTDYSVYDGFLSPEEGAKRAAELEQPALGISDHGTMGGVVDHYLSCKKHGVKPIIGCEGYYQPKFVPGDENYHMTVWAKNMKGYSNLCRMLTESAEKYFYRRPIFTNRQLKKYHEGLVISSGCVGGFIPQQIIAGKQTFAEGVAEHFSGIFGQDFVMEVMPFPVIHEGRDIQEQANRGVLSIAKRLGQPVIMTDDAHYVQENDYPAYRALHELSQSTNGQARKQKTRLSADYTYRYLHDAQGMADAWRDMMGKSGKCYLENTLILAERCTLDLTFNEKEMIPTIDWGMPAKQKLFLLARAMLQISGKWNEEYKDRLKQEMDVVRKLGFEDYFLLCWDIVRFAQSQHIPMGYGRGSVCNSLLGYALGLTNVDPIYFELDFERFLRLDKKALPDVDMDFCTDRRDEVVAYVMNRFAGRSCPISTFGYYDVSGLSNDMAKMYPDMTNADRDAFKFRLKEIGYGRKEGQVHLSLDELRKHTFVGKFIRDFEKKYPGFVEQFVRIFGQIKYGGRHPAGIAITKEEIDTYIPCQKFKGKIQTAYDMNAISALGVLKVDVLGVRKVTVVREVEKLTGAKLTYDLLSDPKTMEALAQGDTDCAFQFESPGIRSFLQKAQPQNFDDVRACTALYRPGSKKSIPAYLSARHGGEVEENVPGYEYLKETYGVLVYDEQKMRIAKNIGHMEWPDVDKLMKQAKKGRIEPELKQKFIRGAVSHGEMSEKEARALVDVLALYTFNKGHATGYSVLSVYSLWQRIYYQKETYMVMLRYAPKKLKTKDRKKEIEASAVGKGEVLLLPHVNGPVTYDIVEDKSGEKAIQAGLQSVSRCGKAALDIVRVRGERPFTSKEDFYERIAQDKDAKRRVNKLVKEELEKCGALEFHRKTFLQKCLAHCNDLQRYANARETGRKRYVKSAERDN